MFRLSIIIPLWADDECFEDTLASVLQNRPSDCEVVVVHSKRYADPYALRGEVRFVQTDGGAGPVRILNDGCRAACGEILHIVQPGVLVGDRWAEYALPAFDDRDVCAVTPLLVDAHDAGSIVAAGLSYSQGGRLSSYGCGTSATNRRNLLRRTPIGPSLVAGFYRRWAWEALGGFCEQLASPWADVDFALSLHALGYRSALASECVLRATGDLISDPASFRSGVCAESVFWRHAAQRGLLAALALHPAAVLRSILETRRPSRACAQLLGRLAGLCRLPSHLASVARIRRATELYLLREASTAAGPRQAFSVRGTVPPRATMYRDAA